MAHMRPKSVRKIQAVRLTQAGNGRRRMATGRPKTRRYISDGSKHGDTGPLGPLKMTAKEHKYTYGLLHQYQTLSLSVLLLL